VKFFLDALVSPVNMINAIDQGIAFCSKACQHESG
jgi:hypothetical protein